MKQEEIRCDFCDVKFLSVPQLQHHYSSTQYRIAMKQLHAKSATEFRSAPDGVYTGRYKLCHRLEMIFSLLVYFACTVKPFYKALQNSWNRGVDKNFAFIAKTSGNLWIFSTAIHVEIHPFLRQYLYDRRNEVHNRTKNSGRGKVELIFSRVTEVN